MATRHCTLIGFSLTVVLSLFLELARPCQAATYYADMARPDDSGNGTSWGTAKKTIQAAIHLTVNSDTVLVASGLYNTGGISNWPVGGLLTNRVAVTNAITLRAASTNPIDTIIAGSPDPGTGSTGNGAVRGVYLAANATLIGFTVSNGYSRLWSAANDGYGGGIYAGAGSLISNCVVITNCAYYAGGIYGGTSTHCRVSGNRAFIGAGLQNAAIWNSTLSGNSATAQGGGSQNSSLYYCTVVSNYAVTLGGGAAGGLMVGCNVISNRADAQCGGIDGINAAQCNIIGNSGGGPGGVNGGTLEQCVIRQNSSAGYGGGAMNATLKNCLVAQNTGADASWAHGGGVYNCNMLNCTVVSNTGCGGGVGHGGLLTNCIVYFNTPADFRNYDGTYAVDYCCTSATNTFTNTVSGLNNITNAPLFAGATSYHLVSGSPGIDAGANLPGVITNDLDGFSRPRSGVIGRTPKWDMGCYEFLPRGAVIYLN